MPTNTKEFSAKQEKMVANYMGWKVVTGSGSRPFTPGDVNSYDFLVECKTHVEPQADIVFHKKHWKKISEEALSKHRYPVLITDNGTQKAENTWVMIPARMIPSAISVELPYDINRARTNSKIVFDHSEMAALYSWTLNIKYFPAMFDDEHIAIMPLETFRQFCTEDFGA